MLMSADDGAVHVVDGPVDLTLSIGPLVQGAQNALPEPAGGPAVEARRHSRPWPIMLGQVAPWCPCAGQSQEAVDDQTMIFGRPTRPRSSRQQGSKPPPFRIRQL